MQPPQFLNREKIGKEILAVEISIEPGWHERISVKEGEDPVKVA